MVIIALVLLLVIPITFYLLFFNFGERDISWIDNVNGFIEEAKPFPEPNPPGEPPTEGMSMYRFYLWENGSDQLIYYTSYKSNNFVAYMRGLLNQVNSVIYSSIGKEFRSEIRGANKVLQFFFRQPEDFESIGEEVQSAYFVLEDNLNKDLEGTIIIHRYISGESEYSLREIRK